MLNQTKILILLISLALILGTGTVLAQNDVTGEINLDENIQATDLGISEPKLLPDNPFYFLKNWGRAIQGFFAFNPITKIELRERFANEKLIELKKMIEEKKKLEDIEKAVENYQEEVEKIKEAAEKIREKAKDNPEVEKFLDKFTKHQILHQRLLQRLENQVPEEVYEKIEEARERHLERFAEVMTKLEDRKEQLQQRLEEKMEEIKGSKYKNFKNLEILLELEEKVPEEAKEAIRRAEENALKRLRGDLEKMSPEDQEKFKEYLERIGGVKERQLEILENLKSELKEKPEIIERIKGAREKIIEKIEEKAKEINCPEIEKPALGFCEEGRIVLKRDARGCITSFECIIPAEIEIPSVWPCKPICDAIGTRSEGWYDSCTKTLIKWDNCEGCEAICKTVGTKSEGWYNSCTGEVIKYGECKEEPAVCITLWDPVCGKDGKTYSNTCFASLAGVEIAYEGACKPKECQIDEDCPQLRCGPAGTISARCIGMKTKCIEGKCQIQSIPSP